MDRLTGREVIVIESIYNGFPVGSRGVVVRTDEGIHADYAYVRDADGEEWMMKLTELALPLVPEGIGV